MKFFIVIALLSSVLTYFVDSNFPGCHPTYQQQSPIDVNTLQTKYYEERFFRVISTNYTELTEEDSWKVLDNSVGFEGNFGTVILVRNWAMYRFNLTKILFRMRSGHRVNGQSTDVEMELVHTIDTDYETPGRYIQPTANTLVISFFFQVDALATPSRLFEFLSLDDLSTKLTSPTRPIKLNRLVQHQPSLLYDGTFDSNSNCQAAWRMVVLNYQVLPSEHLTLLRNVFSTRSLSTGTESNARDLNIVTSTTTVYRNTEEQTLFKPSPLQYDSSRFIPASIIILLGLFLVLLS